MSEIVFGQRKMVQLKHKIKIIVFYSLKEYKTILYKLKRECNTCNCEFNIVPIYTVLSEGNTFEAAIKKQIKKNVSGYMKDIDKICLISNDKIECDKYQIFYTIESFMLWFETLNIGQI